MCTINKSAHMKKVWKLIVCSLYITTCYIRVRIGGDVLLQGCLIFYHTMADERNKILNFNPKQMVLG